MARSLWIATFICALVQGVTGFSPIVYAAAGNKKSNKSRIVPTSRLNLGVPEAWTAYSEALEAHPLIVKSVTASVILGMADLAGQALESAQKGEKSPIDVARTARFAFFGLVLQAPWNHFYYLLLDGTIPPTEEPWTPTTAIKVVIDQFVQAPVFTVLIFGFLGVLEGRNLDSIQKQLKEDYADTMVANCKFQRTPVFSQLLFLISCSEGLPIKPSFSQGNCGFQQPL